MDRYNTGSEGDDVYQPGSDGTVLSNKLCETDPEEMGKIEAQTLYEAISWSDDAYSIDTEFGIETVKEMHKVWLGERYPFAGEIRTVDMSKDGFMFAPVAYLDGSLNEFDKIVRANTLSRSWFTLSAKAMGELPDGWLTSCPCRAGCHHWTGLLKRKLKVGVRLTLLR